MLAKFSTSSIRVKEECPIVPVYVIGIDPSVPVNPIGIELMFMVSVVRIDSSVNHAPKSSCVWLTLSLNSQPCSIMQHILLHWIH